MLLLPTCALDPAVTLSSGWRAADTCHPIEQLKVWNFNPLPVSVTKARDQLVDRGKFIWLGFWRPRSPVCGSGIYRALVGPFPTSDQGGPGPRVSVVPM